MTDCLEHTPTNQGQIPLRHGQLPDRFGHQRSHGVALCIDDRMHQLGTIECAAIGDSRCSIEYLQGGGQDVALADRSIVRIAGDPVLSIVLALPTVARHQTRGLSRKINSGRFAKAERSRPLRQPLYSQPREARVPASDLIEKDVARLANRPYDVQ